MNLYFERSNGEEILVKENVNNEKVLTDIKEYVNKLNPNYKIYYVRSWTIDGKTTYDVGSHTEFFYTK